MPPVPRRRAGDATVPESDHDLLRRVADQTSQVVDWIECHDGEHDKLNEAIAKHFQDAVVRDQEIAAMSGQGPQLQSLAEWRAEMKGAMNVLKWIAVAATAMGGVASFLTALNIAMGH